MSCLPEKTEGCQREWHEDERKMDAIYQYDLIRERERGEERHYYYSLLLFYYAQFELTNQIALHTVHGTWMGEHLK